LRIAGTSGADGRPDPQAEHGDEAGSLAEGTAPPMASGAVCWRPVRSGAGREGAGLTSRRDCRDRTARAVTPSSAATATEVHELRGGRRHFPLEQRHREDHGPVVGLVVDP
jgi:hypothetical protein